VTQALYFDHAATSFPKADGVADEAARFLREDAGNPGRGSHALAGRAADAVRRARGGLAQLLGIGDASRLALVSGATEALNVALHGVLKGGDRVLVGAEAHNSVLRPLNALRARGVTTAEVRCDDVLRWDLDDLEGQLQRGAKLVVVAHGSNVTGVVQDLAGIVARVHAAGAWVLVDAAQTVGALPLNLGDLGVDLLAFSGHKALLGPTGTGGLFVRSGLEVTPLLAGGTGSASEREEQPTGMPGGLEAGTANAVGFAALAVATRVVRELSPATLHARGILLGEALREGVAALPGVTLHAASLPSDLPVVSFVVEGWDPQELAVVLDGVGAAVRAGLHCAPRAHRRLGTLPAGTLRASTGPFLTAEDVDGFCERLAAVLS
jgi:selenocysteine lyase/cysteine desulfurase